MSPFDLNQVSIIPIEEQAADHTSSFLHTPPNLYDRRVDYYLVQHHPQQYPQQEPKEHFLLSGSQDPADIHDEKTLKLSLCNPKIADLEEEITEELAGRPGKWMPSKMRFMRKMMNSAHIAVGKPRGGSTQPSDDYYQSQASVNQQGNGSPGNGIVRVCSDCNTTKTPLWRSGPRGPKSLCNACGIRQRKARRAMAAAAAAALNGGVMPSTMDSKVRKEKKLDIDIDRTLPFKKRCKVNVTTAAAAAAAAVSPPAKKLCFDDALALSSRKNSAAIQNKAFPQEERDAAILLMALSCGLIRS